SARLPRGCLPHYLCLTQGFLVVTFQTLLRRIIPGRRSEAEASPESIHPDLWLWIPGSRPAAEPRNDWAKSLAARSQRSKAKPTIRRRSHPIAATPFALPRLRLRAAGGRRRVRRPASVRPARRRGDGTVARSRSGRAHWRWWCCEAPER